ncbi:hypothetical protein B0T25DRAFT_279226 [Lasiosphaeria hispida]|uniref:Uncharacterized protein n=1 Tax=Lasiosphaeria hispida TaxID=260671 RepID=A0AAJ0HBC9_9PEZI|nr:hypothetical protein B0T25DRAFT_279226 [Lasiosphaeria hispida]
MANTARCISCSKLPISHLVQLAEQEFNATRFPERSFYRHHEFITALELATDDDCDFCQFLLTYLKGHPWVPGGVQPEWYELQLDIEASPTPSPKRSWMSQMCGLLSTHTARAKTFPRKKSGCLILSGFRLETAAPAAPAAPAAMEPRSVSVGGLQLTETWDRNKTLPLPKDGCGSVSIGMTTVASPTTLPPFQPDSSTLASPQRTGAMSYAAIPKLPLPSSSAADRLSAPTISTAALPWR